MRQSVHYKSEDRNNPATWESERVIAAKRWAPILCAFSGARISEICQLRKEDIHLEGGIPFYRIAPEAGSVKTGLYRDVPIHPQLIELGFLDFAKGSLDGPLFFDNHDGKRDAKSAAEYAGQRIGKWIKSFGVLDEGVQPNHAWRHRLKTIGRDLNLDPKTIDVVCGHSIKVISVRHMAPSLY